jgi:hypothetical protein
VKASVKGALPEKSLIGLLLCATSAFSVPLWLFLVTDSEPQRHKEHRACTEKSDRLAFRAKPVKGQKEEMKRREGKMK